MHSISSRCGSAIIAVLLLLPAADALAGPFVSIDGGADYIFDGKDLYANMLDSYTYWHLGTSFGTIRGKSDSIYDYAMNAPEYGVRASFTALGSLNFKPGARFGDLFTVHGFFKPNFYKGNVFSFGPLINAGLSFTRYAWDPVTDPRNLYLGSKVTVNLGVGLEARFQLHPLWSLALQVVGSHRSNGMLRVPNWGINNIDASFALRYHLDPVLPASGKAVKPASDVRKKFLYDIYFNGGVHSCDVDRNMTTELTGEPVLGKAYAKFNLGGTVSYRYHTLFATGLGVDLMYAGNWKRMEELSGLTGEKVTCSPVQVGFYIHQSLFYRHLEMGLDVGIYAYKKMGPEDSGLDYERISLRYNFESVGLFVGTGCRFHHFDRSDTIEFTFGKRF